MMNFCKNWNKKHKDSIYFLARILVGFMFFTHGAGKLFGWFGGKATGFSGMMGLAGIIEFVVGLTIFLGIFTRLMASLGGLLMLTAYFMAHKPENWNILSGGGELALLYLATFLMLTIFGNGKWNLEKTLLGKEKF